MFAMRESNLSRGPEGPSRRRAEGANRLDDGLVARAAWKEQTGCLRLEGDSRRPLIFFK